LIDARGVLGIVLKLWSLADWLSLDEFSCCCSGRWLIGSVCVGSSASGCSCGRLCFGCSWTNLFLVCFCMCETWWEIGKSEVKVRCESSGAKN
jgi:hypothetical protein